MAVNEDVLGQSAGGTFANGVEEFDGGRYDVELKWKRGGASARPAWSDLQIELWLQKTATKRNPAKLAAAETVGEYTYIFHRLDGTPTQPITLQLAGIEEEFASYGVPLRSRSPGFEWSLYGVLYNTVRGLVRFGALLIVLVIVVLVATHRQWWIRYRVGQCPVCGYDLVGNPDFGCPECGWGRGTISKP